MTTDQIVYMMIALLSFVTFMMMLMILMISRLEINNSKRHLSLEMIMYYNVRFHTMLTVLESYQIKETSNGTDLYQKYQRTFQSAVRELSAEISSNCVDNDFVFASNKMSENLKYKSKQLIAVFQDWTDSLKMMDQAFELNHREKLEDESYLDNLWENYNLKYDKMITLVIEMKSLINNDSILEVIR
jgi:hypothetical protein